MIDKQLQPVEWCSFMYELEDALEHLGNLIKDIEHDPDYSDEDLRIDLGHVYAHLNRAWRRSAKAVPDGDWDWASRFPDDLEPVG
ncbi:hypothetical protein [Dyella mobilis]|uniref:Uncharacterized protein n=1 Tax=Dyella mobilis TaxID=1849582 RepID=A0ABS2KEQ3_9GAMM|nr:hypothetical protein [Dyella mobilis]MBM7129569.1 hypothetical protein [Dyella mobilis]GLQ98166.1 hypothetical protein GCM10007863_25860 [Dyella mobilis]